MAVLRLEVASTLQVKLRIPTDEELIGQVAAGDRAAMSILVDRHGACLLNFLWHMTGDRTGAEDLLQEVFMRIHGAAHRYRSNGNFRAWIYTIARRRALSWRRRPSRRIRRLLQREGTAPPPDEVLLVRERAAAVASALEALPEYFRTALVLCALNGFSYEEAAQVSGCSVKTISSRVARARDMLRRALADVMEDQ